MSTWIIQLHLSQRLLQSCCIIHTRESQSDNFCDQYLLENWYAVHYLFCQFIVIKLFWLNSWLYVKKNLVFFNQYFSWYFKIITHYWIINCEIPCQCGPGGKKGIHSKRDDSSKHSSHLTRKAAFLQVDHVAIIKVHHPGYVYGNSCLAGYVNPQDLTATTIRWCGMASLLPRALTSQTQNWGLNW